MKFKVGDRVRAIEKVDGVYLSNKCGTVVENYIAGDRLYIGVEFDEPFVGGHDCRGKGKGGYCRYGLESEFELISPEQKIVITTDGRETLARLYEGNKVVKSAVAKCHPDDAFDFMVGATVAYNRLILPTKEEPKYFKGKAVCIKSTTPSLIVGKIYDFSENNGCGKSEIRQILPKPFQSVDEINRAFGERCEFLEIKE